MNKEVRELVEEAKRQGWRESGDRYGHPMLLAPDGVGKVTLAGTPSDQRWIVKTIARMRRHGLEWPPESKKVQRARTRKEGRQ